MRDEIAAPQDGNAAASGGIDEITACTIDHRHTETLWAGYVVTTTPERCSFKEGKQS